MLLLASLLRSPLETEWCPAGGENNSGNGRRSDSEAASNDVFLFFFAILKVQQEIRFGRSVSKTTAQLKRYSTALTPGHVFGDSEGEVLAWANAATSTGPQASTLRSTNVTPPLPSRVTGRRLSSGMLQNSALTNNWVQIRCCEKDYKLFKAPESLEYRPKRENLQQQVVPSVPD